MTKAPCSRLPFETRIFARTRRRSRCFCADALLAMRLLFIALTVTLATAACSLQSPEPEAHSNMLGLTEKQISSCLGAPAQKSSEGGAEVWSYPDGQSCSV